MKMRLFATTAISLALASATFAQSPGNAPSKNSANPPASQNQPSSTAPSSTSSQPAQSTSQPGQASENSAVGSGTSTSGQSAGSTTPPNSNSTTTSQAPSNSGTATQAQTPPASAPSAQQSANPPPSNANQAQQPSNTNQAQQPANTNQAQQAPNNAGTAAQQPNNTGNTAQSSSTNVNASVNINDQQRTRISQSVAHLNVRPLTNVNFSLSAGTVVPRDVHLSTLPADVVEIVPQYRGYSFVLVKDEIVIIEPSSYKIVATLPYSAGGSTAAAPARERSKVSFSDRDREVIRKQARTRAEGRTESRTTGSSARTEIRVGDRVPESLEVESFPDEVYRESPTLREYRYIHRDSRTYVVEPSERRIIEEIE